MNVQNILQELDSLFRNQQIAQVEPFLLGHLAVARAAADRSAVLTLLNELMGFYRGMSRFKEALATGDEALGLMEAMGYKDSVPYATTLLNVATAYRADGQTARAIGLFEEVGRLFVARNVQDAHLIASLYNNLSLAFQEAGEHAKAIACLDQALPLVASRPGSEVDQAVTCTNRALSRLRLDQLAEAREDLAQAVRLFEGQPVRNSHYGAALAGLGEVAYREGRLQDAVRFYERALGEIHTHYGKNQYYAVTLESLATVYEALEPARAAELQAEAQAIQATLR
ncbi:MAG: tetratricopeptide repeat protein [Candidatus Dactylopiibacterium sp.]|nr:tetratricopeptide repeat protein [Candidatus Dactylopiibacterium sp.]